MAEPLKSDTALGQTSCAPMLGETLSSRLGRAFLKRRRQVADSRLPYIGILKSMLAPPDCAADRDSTRQTRLWKLQGGDACFPGKMERSSKCISLSPHCPTTSSVIFTQEIWNSICRNREIRYFTSYQARTKIHRYAPSSIVNNKGLTVIGYIVLYLVSAAHVACSAKTVGRIYVCM